MARKRLAHIAITLEQALKAQVRVAQEVLDVGITSREVHGELGPKLRENARQRVRKQAEVLPLP